MQTGRIWNLHHTISHQFFLSRSAIFLCEIPPQTETRDHLWPNHIRISPHVCASDARSPQRIATGQTKLAYVRHAQSLQKVTFWWTRPDWRNKILMILKRKFVLGIQHTSESLGRVLLCNQSCRTAHYSNSNAKIHIQITSGEFVKNSACRGWAL